MGKQAVSVLITDFDNTLYDWVRIWYSSFRPFVDHLVRLSGVPSKTLLAEIKSVHQKHRTSEYSFLIQEIPSLLEKHPASELTVVYREAIDAYREGRRRSMYLYPRVLETLQTIRSRGTVIVGYTESMAFYTTYRVKHLGLDACLDFIYSPEDHDLPDRLTPEQIRLYPANTYQLSHAKHRYTPKGELKPNPDLLQKIVTELGADATDCIYLGDSLMKDVEMANRAGVTSVHAKYGEAHETSEYELLKEVTHWSDVDVRREKGFPRGEARYTLERSFSELLALFDFVGPTPKTIPSKDHAESSRLELEVKLWEKTVEVQEHFNELSLKVRTWAVASLGGILTVAALSLKEHIELQIFGVRLPAAVPILVTALLTWWAFLMMDLYWYHRLLKGAVSHGMKIEAGASQHLPMIDLAKTIGEASAVTLRFPFTARVFTLRSDQRLKIFYWVGTAIIVTLLFLAYNTSIDKPLVPSSVSRMESSAPRSSPHVDIPLLSEAL